MPTTEMKPQGNIKRQWCIPKRRTPASSTFTTARYNLLQRKCACGGTPGPSGECSECRKKRLAPQRRAADQADLSSVSPIVHEVLRSPGRPLDPATRYFMEPRFGHDFSKVRVHTNAQAAESARAVGARAYTVGREIVFGAKQYAPQTAQGQRLLAHELTHTIQQDTGAWHLPTSLQMTSVGDATEQEAERAARAIGSRHAVAATTPSLIQVARQGQNAAAVAGASTSAPTSSPPAPPTVYEHNTELGGLSVGNFDFHFRNCAILVWVWVKFQFASDITTAEQAAFKLRFINAIHNVWAHTGYSLTGSAGCSCSTVPIEIHVEESTSGFYHKLVDVERGGGRRESVISDINVNLSSNDITLAHEFGHVLGLYDEYDGGFFENIMFWHRNRPDDPNALMNLGTELRPRYFEHYRSRVQETAQAGCTYSVSSPVPPGP